jgi:biopolymer transport protein ExbD
MLPPLDDIEVEKINDNNASDKKAKREVTVDMNPMVDLAFLLLTFFMLATTFSRPQAMELLVPAKSEENAVEKETPVKESKTLNLLLLEDKLYWYNGITEPTEKELSYNQAEIEALVQAQMKSIQDLVVLIKADSSSEYGKLVTVLDVMKIKQVPRYALAPLNDFDKELALRDNNGN